MNRSALLVAFAVGAAAACGSPDEALPPGWIDADRFANADSEPGQWLSTGRSPYEQHFSPLDLIDTGNVERLGFEWEYVARPLRGRVQHGMQATAIVVDGTMYVPGPWSVVYALDAATGKQRWRYDPGVDGAIARSSCCGVSSRGVVVWKGRVYVATFDGYLIALDAGTGAEVWRVDTFIDRSADYTITGAPHVAGDKIVVGNSGADFGVRGYVSAYELESGEFAWRFFTVPGNPASDFEHPEMELAATTWDPSSIWEAGLGGTVWGDMAYDPQADLLYVGTGNSSPYPAWFRSPSGGDNLFLASILAIRPNTGRLAWHYQTVPGEIWDYTVSSNLVLADLEIDGEIRNVLMTAPKNGFYYVLDRITGELLSAEKYVRVTWASHVDMENGRPVISSDAWYEDGPKLVFPSSFGGHNWEPMSFSPKSGLAYIPTIERGMIYAATPDLDFRTHHIYQGVSLAIDDETIMRLTDGDPSLLETREFLKAWDPVTQAERWRVPTPGQFNGGVLATGGDLVVQGRSDGHLVVYRASDGATLKDIQIGTGILAAPMTYAIEGEQYIAIMAGYGGGPGIQFYPGTAPYEYENYPRIIAFKLDGGPVALPPRRVEVPAPAPPQMEVDPAVADLGAGLYATYCSYCHGGGWGSLSAYPDLTRLPAAVHQNFHAIVLEGALESVGMAGFSDILTEEQVDAIQAYLITEQRKAYRANLVASR